MRKVLNRTLGPGVVAALMVAALMVAFLGAGLMLEPQKATAQTGGLMAGHATFNHGDLHRFVGQPLVRPGQMPPVVVSGSPATVNRTSGLEPARHHRRIFGFGLPVTGIGVSFGPFDEPIAYVGAIGLPAGPSAAGEGSPIPQGGGGCRSETRIVSSEAGGERPIKITWCRKG